MAAHQPAWIPYLGFFDKVIKSDVFVILDDVQYSKNGFINRNKIRTSDGEQWITIPVKKDSYKKTINKTVVADTKYKKKIEKTLFQNYSKSNFWGSYSNTIINLLDFNSNKLFEINMKWLKWLLNELEIPTKIILQSELIKSDLQKTDMLIDLCNQTGCHHYLSGIGARKYLNKKGMNGNGIKVTWQFFNHPTYNQVYKPFIENLSVIDALFNLGPLLMQKI
jgi:hypothetical protein